MEFIFEFLFELIIGGMADASGSPRIPKWLRIIFATVIAGVLFVPMLIIGIISSTKGNAGAAILFFVVAALALVLWFFLLRKIKRSV